MSPGQAERFRREQVVDRYALIVAGMARTLIDRATAPGAQYWDVPVEGQTEATAPDRVLEFLGSVTADSDSTPQRPGR